MTTKQANKEQKVLELIIRWGANEKEAKDLVAKDFPATFDMMPTSTPTKIAECLLANW